MALFSGFLGGQKKGESVLGIDIGSSSLKVVQLRRSRGRAVLETYGELALGPYAGKEVGQATQLSADVVTTTLKDLLREANVTTKECGVSIPSARSLLTLVQLPRRKNQEEQKTVIQLEARKYIPVPINEVQLDWFIVPEEISTPAQESKVDVLLVAVQNDELQLLETAIRGAELNSHFYELEIFSSVRAVVNEPVKPVLVLDIGASTTKAYVVEHGVVAFSHTIPHGGQDATQAISASSNLSLKQAEDNKKKGGFAGDDEVRKSLDLVYSGIFAETKRVFLEYETHRQRTIAEIVLTGGGGVAKGLGTYAQTFFSAQVRIADPFDKTEAPAFMRPVLEGIGPEFAVAVGIALRLLEEGR